MQTSKAKFIFIILLFFLAGISSKPADWIAEKHTGYTIHYAEKDKADVAAYCKIIDDGLKSVNAFFSGRFKNDFDVYVHPSRASLDLQWRKDWNIPDFKSECWMVASGIATKLDMIAPRSWDAEACEHRFADTLDTQRLITHELVHVFHGQNNPSPDFSAVTGLDWFVEGLATYASGQCDSARIRQVKEAISKNEIPSSLDNFWTGKIKYGLSGSVVMYLDNKYGRDKLIELLGLTKKEELLNKLQTNEAALLEGWKNLCYYSDTNK